MEKPVYAQPISHITNVWCKYLVVGEKNYVLRF